MKAASEAGVETRQAYGLQAELVKERSRIEAREIREEGFQTAETIRAQNAASGFELDGSPYMVMQQSLRDAEEDAEDVLKYGAQEADYLNQTGRATSKAMEQQGYAQGLGGLGTAFSGQSGLSNVKIGGA